MPFPWEGQSVVWKKSGCAFLNQGNPLSLKWTETPIRAAFPKVGYVTSQSLEKKPFVLLDRWIVLHLFMFICSMLCGPCFTSKDRFGEPNAWKSSSSKILSLFDIVWNQPNLGYIHWNITQHFIGSVYALLDPCCWLTTSSILWYAQITSYIAPSMTRWVHTPY